MRSATVAVVAPEMPRWVSSVLLRLSRRWYDPAIAQQKKDRTDAAVTRTSKAVEAYRRESRALGKR